MAWTHASRSLSFSRTNTNRWSPSSSTRSATSLDSSIALFTNATHHNLFPRTLTKNRKLRVLTRRRHAQLVILPFWLGAYGPHNPGETPHALACTMNRLPDSTCFAEYQKYEWVLVRRMSELGSAWKTYVFVEEEKTTVSQDKILPVPLPFAC